ncbi:YpoC family protein [Niallia sp. 03133]|uniref:YpoC family protein n=1 Tax=Niallia sp. 03133 TaxID=3458060 RepID=UPI004043B0A7
MEKEITFPLPEQLLVANLPVPAEFRMNDISLLNTFQLNDPFIHEAAYFLNFQVYHPYQPWVKENVRESVGALLKEWQLLKKEIKISISNHNKKETDEMMKKGVLYFLECLYWTNEIPVSFERGLIKEEIKIKPINVKERFAFIVSRLTGYHSFKQLDELYKELEKQFAIKMSKRKS